MPPRTTSFGGAGGAAAASFGAGCAADCVVAADCAVAADCGAAEGAGCAPPFASARGSAFTRLGAGDQAKAMRGAKFQPLRTFVWFS